MARLRLKLLIDKRRNRVLFAEAGKDFVDFIFHILSFPLGTLVRILSDATDHEEGTAMPGSLRSLYEGVSRLPYRYLDHTSRGSLLYSRAPFRGTSSHELLPPDASLPGVVDLWTYDCSESSETVYCSTHGETPDSLKCPFSGDHHCLKKKVILSSTPRDLRVVKGGDGGGYVQCHPYMVMDDLAVEPLSTEFVLPLVGLTENLSNLENQEVDFGKIEAVKLLKAFLRSKTVLTDVFLNDVAATEEGVSPKSALFQTQKTDGILELSLHTSSG